MAMSRESSLIVDLLWKIKRRLESGQSTSIGFVHFNMLLQDTSYRNDVLQKAKASGDPVLEALAKEAEARETGRPIRHHDGRAGITSNTAHQPTNDQPTAHPLRRNLYWIAPVLLACIGLLGFVVEMGPQRVIVDQPIRENTVWRTGQVYVLRGLVYIEDNAELSIEPGVRVHGEHGSALIATRGARLFARGQSARPIVFTSDQPVGERSSGDWGGLVLLGDAPVNRANARIEGVPEDDGRGSFGGDNRNSSCGVLEYVRIEFAGYEVYANNELNGLTLGGCGANTIVRNIQVHRALDDGIEIFGGGADLKNVVITGAGDDSLDWDLGWQGRVQFLIAQQYPGTGDNAFEGDSNKSDHDALPRSVSEFYNVTLIGTGSLGKSNRAMTLRRGSGGRFNNMVIDSFGSDALDTRDQVQSIVDERLLDFSHNLIAATGSVGFEFTEELGEADDDHSFSETAFVRDTLRGNQVLARSILPRAAYDLEQPNYRPSLGVNDMRGGEVPKGEFWDSSAAYYGAINPIGEANWTNSWTSYPLH